MSERKPPRSVYFKKQTLNMWRVTDSDGLRHVNADQAFAYMQELVEGGWRLNMQESVTGSVLSVTMTEPKE